MKIKHTLVRDTPSPGDWLPSLKDLPIGMYFKYCSRFGHLRRKIDHKFNYNYVVERNTENEFDVEVIVVNQDGNIK